MKNIIVNNQYNIGHICTRLQCDLGKSEKIAMRLVAPDLTRTDYTFRDLDFQSNKAANALRQMPLKLH